MSFDLIYCEYEYIGELVESFICSVPPATADMLVSFSLLVLFLISLGIVKIIVDLLK